MSDGGKWLRVDWVTLCRLGLAENRDHSDGCPDIERAVYSAILSMPDASMLRVIGNVARCAETGTASFNDAWDKKKEANNGGTN